MNHLKETQQERRIEAMARGLKSAWYAMDRIDIAEDLPTPYAVLEAVELAWSHCTEKEIAKRVRFLAETLAEAASELEDELEDDDHVEKEGI